MEVIYFARIIYEAENKIRWEFVQRKVLEETPLHFIAKAEHERNFLIPKDTLDQVCGYYHTTKQSALASIQRRIEQDMERCKKAIQSYQEALYDLEREM